MYVGSESHCGSPSGGASLQFRDGVAWWIEHAITQPP
jgi:hypothetical protein